MQYVLMIHPSLRFIKSCDNVKVTEIVKLKRFRFFIILPSKGKESSDKYDKIIWRGDAYVRKNT